MINLLPYSHRIQLKSLYKKRLIVVGLFGVGTVFLPLLLVIGVLSYIEFTNIKILDSNYQKLIDARNLTGTDDLSNNVKSINKSINFFESNIYKSKKVTDNIQSLISLRPKDVTVNSFDFKKTDKAGVISIRGVSVSRNSIIEYSNILDVKNNGICNTINIPVDTYTKKNEVPFALICTIDYETK